MKFSEIQMTWLRILCFEFCGDFYIKCDFGGQIQICFPYIHIVSHINSDFVSDESGRSDTVFNLKQQQKITFRRIESLRTLQGKILDFILQSKWS